FGLRISDLLSLDAYLGGGVGSDNVQRGNGSLAHFIVTVFAGRFGKRRDDGVFLVIFVRNEAERETSHLPQHRVLALQDADQNRNRGFVMQFIINQRQRSLHSHVLIGVIERAAQSGF